MSNQSVETVSTSNDKIKIALAVALAIAGVVGFYFFSDKQAIVRAGVLALGLLAAIGMAWTSTPGREFLSFAKESVRETRKVVWPSRKEAMQVTAIVFVFVLLMAIFLWLTDKVLEYALYDLILGWRK